MEGEEEDLSLIMGLIIGQIFTSHFLGPGSDNSGLQRHLQLDCKPRTDQLVSQLAVPKYVKERCGGFLEIYGKKYFNCQQKNEIDLIDSHDYCSASFVIFLPKEL